MIVSRSNKEICVSDKVKECNVLVFSESEKDIVNNYYEAIEVSKVLTNVL